MIKKILALLLSLTVIIGCMPFALAEKKEEGAMPLVTISDIHYYPERLSRFQGEAFYNYLQGSNCLFEDIGGILDATFAELTRKAKEEGLKYVVISGDLTVNGELEGHEELAVRLKELEENSGLQVFVCGGNHDINNSNASQFTVADYEKYSANITTPQQFYQIYSEFGFSDATDSLYDFDSGKAGALSYAVSLPEGYRLIIPDAGKYSKDNTKNGENEHETAGNMTDEVVNWVLQQAEKAKNAGETPILFTHWNLSEMNYFHGELLQGFVIDNAYKLQEIFADAGIHYAFSGHQHVSDIDVTYSDGGEVLYSVITPTLTQFPFCFRETYFSKGSNGSVSADFQQYDVDVSKQVISRLGKAYPSPYEQTTGFSKQFGDLNAAQYLLSLAKNLLADWVIEIKTQGSVVGFLKSHFDLDLYQTIDDLIHGGLVFEGDKVFTTDNIMAFINDLDSQLVSVYLEDPEVLWNVLYEGLFDLMDTPVSEVPCTKFISSYGFGNENRGGTLGDLLFSALCYMYKGNEDISDDLFIQDVLVNCQKPEFIDLIFTAVKKNVVEEVVVNELLANMEVHFNTLFSNPLGGAATFIQGLYQIILALLDVKMFTPGGIEEFTERLKALTALMNSGKTVTYKYLVDSVLNTGLIPYGKTVDELADNLLAKFFGDDQKQAMAYQIFIIADGIFNDPDLDWNVTYAYNGAIKVTPTKEDAQLPVNITVTLGQTPTTVEISWFTKYSVTETDAEIVKAATNFAFDPLTVKQAKIETETVNVSGFGFDFGTFGILPWNRDMILHRVTVSDLQPDTDYKYLIGDFQKGFTAMGTFSTASSYTQSFSFLLSGDSAGVTPAQYEKTSLVAAAALNGERELDFWLQMGDGVMTPNNYDQWSWSMEAGERLYRSMPVFRVSGEKDLSDNNYLNSVFSYPSAPVFGANEYGAYYSFDYGSCHFIVLNTNDLDDSGTLSYGQYKWLQRDLEASAEADWKFLILHNGLLATTDTQNEALVEQLLPIIRENKIDFVFTSNDYLYARTHVMNGKTVYDDADTMIKTFMGQEYVTYVNTDGFVNVATGNMCEKKALSELAYPDYIKKSDDSGRSSYTVVSVEGNTVALDTYAVNADGSTELIDNFALTHENIQKKRGDVDLDGEITAADARMALRYTVGLQKLNSVQLKCADADNNGVVDVADARQILRATVKLTKILPIYVDIF